MATANDALLKYIHGEASLLKSFCDETDFALLYWLVRVLQYVFILLR